MGHSQAEKALSRERILAEAAAQIREAGLGSVSVAGLMTSVGLTHGGFYGHFSSRSELLAQALERALVEGEATAHGPLGSARPRGFIEVVKGYLSRAHRDARGRGCAIAALAPEVGRADVASRAVMSAHIEDIARRLAAMLDGDHDRALAAFSTMVGAVSLARVMVDPAASERVLRAARDHLLQMPGGLSPPPSA